MASWLEFPFFLRVDEFLAQPDDAVRLSLRYRSFYHDLLPDSSILLTLVVRNAFQEPANLLDGNLFEVSLPLQHSHFVFSPNSTVAGKRSYGSTL